MKVTTATLLILIGCMGCSKGRPPDMAAASTNSLDSEDHAAQTPTRVDHNAGSSQITDVDPKIPGGALCGRVDPNLEVTCTEPKDCVFKGRGSNPAFSLDSGAGSAHYVPSTICYGLGEAKLDAKCWSEAQNSRNEIKVELVGTAIRKGHECVGCAGSAADVRPVWSTKLQLSGSPPQQHRVVVQLISQRFTQEPGICSLKLGSAVEWIPTGLEHVQKFEALVSTSEYPIQLRCHLAHRAQFGDKREACRELENQEALTVLVMSEPVP